MAEMPRNHNGFVYDPGKTWKSNSNAYKHNHVTTEKQEAIECQNSKAAHACKTALIAQNKLVNKRLPQSNYSKRKRISCCSFENESQN